MVYQVRPAAGAVDVLRFGRAYTLKERKTAIETLQGAMDALGKKDLTLNVHDYMVAPTRSDKDTGIGSLYGDPGDAFVKAILAEGFTGLLVNPQGMVSGDNPNPYDGQAFARNILTLDLQQIAELGLINAADIQREHQTDMAFENGTLEQINYEMVAKHYDVLLHQAYQTFLQKRSKALAEQFQTFVADNDFWLPKAALFHVLSRDEHANQPFSKWPELDKQLMSGDGSETEKKTRLEALHTKYREELDYFAFCQFLAFQQHERFKNRLNDHYDMQIAGDVAIGLSRTEEWGFPDLILDHYRMSAPPSRTNPAGQAWNFALLDPEQYQNGGIEFFRKRVELLATLYNQLRIDHPHGYVNPWVSPFDPELPNDENQRLVREQGGRLFSSPDHPVLGKFSHIRPDQLNESLDPWDDEWEIDITDAQLDQYDVLMRVLIDTMKQAYDTQEIPIIAEVLSTCPKPLLKILARHELGRMRVLEKMDPDNPNDPYLPVHAKPADWLMTSTHDTPPVWAVIADAKNWGNPEKQDKIIHYMAEILFPKTRDPEQHQDFVDELKATPTLMGTALLAVALASASQHLIIPITDLLGIQTRLNSPGEYSQSNWSMRLSANWQTHYEKALQQRRALNIPQAFVWALQSRSQNSPNPFAYATLITSLSELASIRELPDAA